MRYFLKSLVRCGNAKGLAFSFVIIAMLLTLVLVPFISAGASWLSNCCDGGDCCIENDCSCPQCYGRGEPGGVCPDCGAGLCPDCGNCPNCGTSPCPKCRVCTECGSHNYCKTCLGCLDCDHGRDPDCPECGDKKEAAPISETDTDTDIGGGLLDEPVPLFSIGGVDIYLFAPLGISSWAILSLVFTALGLGVTAFVIFRAVRQKKDENAAIDEHSAILRNVDTFDNDRVSKVAEDKERYNKRRRLGAFSLMYLFAAAAVLLIILFQDFTGIIVLFDFWVIIHAALFAGVLVSGKLVFRKYEDYDDDDGAIPLSAVSPS